MASNPKSWTPLARLVAGDKVESQELTLFCGRDSLVADFDIDINSSYYCHD